MKKRTFYKSMIAVNIGLFLIMVVTALYNGQVKVIGLSFQTLAYAGLFWIIDRKEKEIEDIIEKNLNLSVIARKLLFDCRRYHDLYGKLPEEEPKQETNETERTDESKD